MLQVLRSRSMSSTGIAARRHRPDHLIHVGRIDVLIDGDDPLGEVRAARNLRGERQHLRRVAGIALFQTDDRHAEAAGGRRVRVDTLDARHAELLEVVPDPRRAQHAKKPLCSHDG